MTDWAPLFDRPGSSAEAQAFFLLASAAAQRFTRAQPDNQPDNQPVS